MGYDGRLYFTVNDNAPPIDITPYATPMFYTYDLQVSKHNLEIHANGSVLSEDAALSEFVVGQKVTLSGYLNPPVPGLAQVDLSSWQLTGSLVNDSSQSSGSLNYFLNPALLQQPAMHGWWYSGGAKRAYLGQTLSFANGQAAVITGDGYFRIYRPTVTFSNVTPRSFTHWPSGYLGWWNVKLDNRSETQGDMIFDLIYTSSYPGSVGVTQLCKLDFSGHYGSWSFTDWRADGGEWYCAPVPLPNSGVTLQEFSAFPENEGWSPVQLKGEFCVFARFQPSLPEAIFVTLGRAQWNLNAKLVVPATGGVYYETLSCPNPVFDVSGEFPTWERTHF